MVINVNEFPSIQEKKNHALSCYTINPQFQFRSELY